MVKFSTPVPDSSARPMASEQVTAGVNGEAVRLPEQKALSFYRYEMYGRSALGDLALKDDEGNNIVYTDLEIATAHLESLPIFDKDSSMPTVFYFRAVYEVDQFNASVHWMNVNKTETVEIFVKELDSKGKVREVPKRVTRNVFEDYEAMEKFRAARRTRNATTSALRSQLYSNIAKIAAAR